MGNNWERVESRLLDRSVPVSEWQIQNRTTRNANIVAGKPAYAGVRIQTRGELDWILREEINLSDYSQGGIDLSRVDMRGARLGDAQLPRAKLIGALLDYADLAGANLDEADLTGAELRRVNLSGAILWGANLCGCFMNNADLRGADLRDARMDHLTRLHEIMMSPLTWLGGVDWNGTLLNRVDWEQVPIIADEEAIAKSVNRRTTVHAIRAAARGYRGLAISLRNQGLSIPASRYKLREQRLECRALRLERRFVAWIGSKLLDAVAGYGELPGRAFRTYAMVVLFFALVYFGLTNYGSTVYASGSHPLLWYEALVLSVSSFHGRGFFPQTLSLGDPVAIVAAAEAIMGLFIEITFIATFTQRFFAR